MGLLRYGEPTSPTPCLSFWHVLGWPPDPFEVKPAHLLMHTC